MIQYILECIAFQLVFLIIYDFFLKKETFFQWNRSYLIGTYILSLVLPWVKIEAFKTTIPAKYYVHPQLLGNIDLTSKEINQNAWFAISWDYAVLLSGMVLASIYFGQKLYQIHALRKKGQVHYFPNFTRVVVTNSQLAFSFFRSIFLGDKVLEKEHENIIQHELVHIRQKHSWDLLFFELMRIAGWFNPLVYVYQNRISELHEFIADAQVAKTDKIEQYETLLSQVFQTQHISFINQFFKTSLIRKRIAMLEKMKSKKVWQLKYLILVPLIMGMLVYTSCEQDVKELEGDGSNIIEVKDVENLTSSEERIVFSQLKQLSEQQKVWELIVKDENSTLMFMPSFGDSYISGPNNEKINARMSIDYIDSQKVFKNFKSVSDLNVPFAVSDTPPIFPGCESATDQRACFNEMLQKHISKNFMYPEEAQEKSIQGKVYVNFIIAKDGKIRNIRLRGPDKLLEDETKRIIETLPQMKPGMNNGDYVNIPFSLPITFKLQGGAEENVEFRETNLESEDVPFAYIDEVPVFPGCENAHDKRNCFREKLMEQVSKNFRYPKEAQEKGIQGKVYVNFVIDEEGNIAEIRKRGPDPQLEDEAERIIKLLPKLTPGKSKGKAVRVPFSLPISFKLK